MTTSLINPALDIAALRSEFELDGKVRIGDVLRPDFADALHDCLARDVPWELAYYNPDASGTAVVGRLSAEQRASMTPEQSHALLERINNEAQTRFQYLYEAYDVLKARREGRDPGLLLQEFLSFMGSDELFAFIRSLTGDEHFNRVDCHACRYQRGHFLKEHADTSPFEERRMAYVFYFTRDWHADFGGLTYFLDDQKQVTDSFIPDYNSLTLFQVPVAHCVSQVASFAPRSRHSITGWFTRYQ